jgi:hypothetical protein
MFDAKRAELMRESVAARRPSGFINTAAGLGVQFAAGALDPANLAAALIPGVGEARAAEWLADAGSALGRAVVRTGVGVAAGAVGTAPIAGLSYGLSREEGGDMTASDALLNIALGGVLGGGLHALGGAIGETISPFKSNPGRARVDTAASALADAPLNVREAALRTSIAQLVSGQPVEIAPLFSADHLGGVTRGLGDLDTETQQIMGEPANDPGLQQNLEVLRGHAAQPAPAQSFMGALRSFGPLKDDQGELDSLGLDSKSAPGLVSKTGRSLDDVALDMHEAGWLGEKGGDRPQINDLLNAIYEETHGSPHIHPSDTAALEHAASLRDLDNTLGERGIDLGSNSNREVERQLNGEPGRGPATAADHAAHDEAYLTIQGDRFKQAARYASGETPLPEDAAASKLADNAAKAPPTLMDEEIAHLENGVRAGQAAGDLPHIPELDVANANVARAEAMKAGFAQAAECLAVSGA